MLTAEGTPTPGCKEKWGDHVVESILTNEKYYGAAILQKKITVSFLTKQMKKNEGEAPMYFIENSHAPVVSPPVFELVQEEFRRRRSVGGNTYSNSIFSSRIVCGECGASYGRKIWHSTDKYRRAVWQCNNKFHNPAKCKTPHLYEDTIKRLFVEAFNSIIENRDEILADYELIATRVTGCTELEKHRKAVDGQCVDLEAAIEKFVNENARAALYQNEYKRRYDDYVEKYQALRDQYAEFTAKITRKKAKYIQMMEFLKILKTQDDLMTDFDEKLWCLTVTALVIKSKTEVVFQFKDGSEKPWPLKGH
jgi:site-specific DNA recombinase